MFHNAMISACLIIVLLVCCPALAAKGDKKGQLEEASAFFAEGLVPRFRIELAQSEMDELRRNAREYVRCTVRESTPGRPDKVYANVGIHLKGGAGSFRGLEANPALTLNFNKFTRGQRFHGLEKIHLNNSVQDASLLNEHVGRSIFRDAGIPTPRGSHARVWLNGKDLGVYVLLEGFDDVFLRTFFGDDSGPVYESQIQEISPNLAAKTNEKVANRERLKELIDAARENDPIKRRERLDKILDVDRFLTFIAVEALIAHWDGYAGNRNNYRIYDDPASGKLVFLPHGMDQIFAQPNFPIILQTGWLARLLTESPEDRAQYLDRLAELRAKVMDPDRVVAHIDRFSQQAMPALAEVSHRAAQYHKELAENLRRQVRERVKNVDQQIAAIPRPLRFSAEGTAALGQWQPRVEGGNTKTERVKDGDIPCLYIGADGGSSASWRTTALLTRGRYVLEGRVRTAGVVAPDGPGTGAGLRISGGQRVNRLAGDSQWQNLEHEFEVAEPTREVMFVCELKATAGQAWFDEGSLRLRKR